MNKTKFIKEAEVWTDSLAKKIIPRENLNGFLSLDVEGKLTGIAFFAHLANDEKVCTTAMKTIQIIKEAAK